MFVCVCALHVREHYAYVCLFVPMWASGDGTVLVLFSFARPGGV